MYTVHDVNTEIKETARGYLLTHSGDEFWTRKKA
jgi:hypothetical protein